MKGKTIVLAEHVHDVVIVTPRTLDRARGVVAREVLVTVDIAGQVGYRDLWHAIEPCFATTPADPRPCAICGGTDHQTLLHGVDAEPTVTGREDES